MNNFREKFRQYMYYGIICMLMVVALVFLPLIDTTGSLGFEKPQTALGWTQYIVIRSLVGVICYLIFVSFDAQGKVNILKDERYIKAYNKLYSVRDKKYIPMSPTGYAIRTKGIKAVTLSLSMIVTAFMVIEAVLSYNYSILVAYGITIFMTVINGLFQMMKSGNYWTEEFPMWVDYHLENIQASTAKAEKESKTECLNLETQNSET